MHSLFFFNVTATPEIYTTLHTLSLHAALPISCPACNGMGYRPMTEDEEADAAIDLDAAAGDECRAFTEQPDDRRTDLDFRSEEHTSELQSLMRISYAVFCLKKKKKM